MCTLPSNWIVSRVEKWWGWYSGIPGWRPPPPLRASFPKPFLSKLHLNQPSAGQPSLKSTLPDFFQPMLGKFKSGKTVMHWTPNQISTPKLNIPGQISKPEKRQTNGLNLFKSSNDVGLLVLASWPFACRRCRGLFHLGHFLPLLLFCLLPLLLLFC